MVYNPNFTTVFVGDISIATMVYKNMHPLVNVYKTLWEKKTSLLQHILTSSYHIFFLEILDGTRLFRNGVSITPSVKRLCNYGKSPCYLRGKVAISTVPLPEGNL